VGQITKAKLQGLLPVWERFVQYANADFDANTQAVETFEELLSVCTSWLMKADPREVQVNFASSGVPVHREGLLKLASQAQPNIRQVLTWLCNPNGDPKQAKSALQFLWHQVEGIKCEAVLNETFDETGKHGLPVLYGKKFQGKAPGLLCKFILDRIDYFNEGDEELRRIIPIGICARPDCGKFMVIQRIGKSEYHSDACKVKHWQSLNRERRAEYMRDRRAKERKEAGRRSHQEKKASKAKFARPKRRNP
jgi:hypothetical protein